MVTSRTVPCRGEAVEPYSECLAHLSARDRARHMNSMHERRSVSYRGTTIDSDLFRHITTVLEQGNTQASFSYCRFTGEVLQPAGAFRSPISFASAVFEGMAYFIEVQFLQGVEFDGAKFQDSAFFEDAKFHEVTSFDGATFEAWATFERAHFGNDVFFQEVQFEKAAFDSASFTEWALFKGATFSAKASFARAQFQKIAEFQGVKFGNVASFSETEFMQIAHFDDAASDADMVFNRARFTELPRLGPIRCKGHLDLSHTRFDQPVLLIADASSALIRHTIFLSHASAQLTGANLDLTHAVLNQPMDIIGTPATIDFETGSIQSVSVSSLRGVDCAMLTLAGVSLTNCTFSGAVHLDQLRLEGRWHFNASPHGFSFTPPFRYTRRQVIEEERRRRSLSGRRNSQIVWGSPPIDRSTPRHDALAIIYRQLRKSREDAKDEPGAADFYFGEMEMRRLSRNWSTSERWLLQVYWLLSGYGLRASRALGWLCLAMLTTILLMMGFGLPQNSPGQEATGVLPPNGGKITFEIDQKDAANPDAERFNSGRFEKALKVTLNSVVFRSSGQELTTAGDYIEMASRFCEPALIGLAVLAIRGRVKR
ncbi:pentapeptide repeat-containing protein [Streptomyces parvulus]|uniref:pentapeptide repeat-containing protein n=1 Tax=Streptomyces parvulus TaxID=146923 RepID=UPI001CFA7F5C|nr:pentapeptide repeat-containing protein [Streptomyces parvulus]